MLHTILAFFILFVSFCMNVRIMHRSTSVSIRISSIPYLSVLIKASVKLLNVNVMLLFIALLTCYTSSFSKNLCYYNFESLIQVLVFQYVPSA